MMSAETMDLPGAIMEYITGMGLGPGDSLPSEAYFAQLFTCSRPRVREAVQRLVALDLITVRRGSGMYVGSGSFAWLHEFLGHSIQLRHAEGTTPMVELLDLRIAIETGHAATFMRNADAEALADLDRLAAAISDPRIGELERASTDRAFHRRLVHTTGNGIAVEISEAFWQAFERLGEDLPRQSEADQRAARAAHADLVDAIREQDMSKYNEAMDAHYLPLRMAWTVSAFQD